MYRLSGFISCIKGMRVGLVVVVLVVWYEDESACCYHLLSYPLQAVCLVLTYVLCVKKEYSCIEGVIARFEMVVLMDYQNQLLVISSSHWKQSVWHGRGHIMVPFWWFLVSHAPLLCCLLLSCAVLQPGKGLSLSCSILNLVN